MRELRGMTFMKWIVCLIMLDTLFFMCTSQLVIFGIGTSYNDAACATGIWICMIVFLLQKILIYGELSTGMVHFSRVPRRILLTQASSYPVFLMERVLLVHAHDAVQGHGIVSRFRNKWYIVAVIFLMIW